MRTKSSSRSPSFTARQRQVLDLLAQDRTNPEIASALGIGLDGAKWHVREILGILGVDSREEAAEYWRRENGLRLRLSRLSRVLIPASGKGLVAASGLGVAVIAGVIVVLTILPASADPPEGTPPATPPAPASSDTVGFKLCELTTGWQKPAPAAMATVFATPRFLDANGGRLHPALWAMYQSSFYWISIPLANSARIEPASMSGIATRDPARTQHLCSSGDFPNSAQYQSLWLLDHRAVSMTRDVDELVVVVKPDLGTFQSVSFPFPTVPDSYPRDKNAPLLFKAIRIQDRDGRLLFRKRLPGAGGEWTTEYDDTGSLRYAVSQGQLQGSITVTAPIDVDIVRAGPTARGKVVLLDNAGAEVRGYVIPDGGAAWDVIATVHLDAGTPTLRFEASDAARESGGFVLFPVGSPRP